MRKFMHIARLVSIVVLALFCETVVSVQENQAKLCGSQEYLGLGVTAAYLKEEVSLEEFVQDLLRIDLESRERILNEEYPEYLSKKAPFIKLEYISKLDMVSKANCFVSLFREGDRIEKYEIRKKRLGFESGYVLLRSDQIIAYAIQDLLLF